VCVRLTTLNTQFYITTPPHTYMYTYIYDGVVVKECAIVYLGQHWRCFLSTGGIGWSQWLAVGM